MKYKILLILFFVFHFFLLSNHIQAQCLTTEESKHTINLINDSPKVTEDKTLRQELLNMQESRQKIEAGIIEKWNDNKDLIQRAESLGKQNLLNLCGMIKSHGWVRQELVGKNGVQAAASILSNTREVSALKEIYPVVLAAIKNGLIDKSVLAFMIDNIRIGSDLPQVFGTQFSFKDELFYLYPLQNEAKVDELRKLYNLPSQREFMMQLQFRYHIPVIQLPKLHISTEKKEKSNPPKKEILNDIFNGSEKEEVIKVESTLVNLNVRVKADILNDLPVKSLQKSDFVIMEDGQEQEINSFATVDSPLDIVLVLDLSGSAADKQGLMRLSTRRFIEAARPIDRLGIVTFATGVEVVSNLTQNREELLKSVDKIRGDGLSGIWSAVEYTIQNVIKPEGDKRRSVVVLMTDGLDSLLRGDYWDNLPPLPVFAHLLELIKANNTTIIPIYLDTETYSDTATPTETEIKRRYFRQARRTLLIMADESGGEVYYAKKLSDLNGLYEKIIKDLGNVYTLSYTPTDSTRDGLWRNVVVKVKNQPELMTLTKKGYYAK